MLVSFVDISNTPSKIDRAVAKSDHPEARYTLPKTSEVLWEFCMKFNQGLENFDIKHCIPNKLEIRHDRLLCKKKNVYAQETLIFTSPVIICCINWLIFTDVWNEYIAFLFIMN